MALLNWKGYIECGRQGYRIEVSTQFKISLLVYKSSDIDGAGRRSTRHQPGLSNRIPRISSHTLSVFLGLGLLSRLSMFSPPHYLPACVTHHRAMPCPDEFVTATLRCALLRPSMHRGISNTGNVEIPERLETHPRVKVHQYQSTSYMSAACSRPADGFPGFTVDVTTVIII